ncbi:Uncharacterized conserved protein [Candidatus Ornithobacterium hominis]|uniref:Uncharacterized conserved protein n=1 Tax=Candidatus Ornithobacterium hominis TaxID=2497989 RepID=A0A383TUT3_9FLAO|nr:GatB/YqeY domain-containing protein [Candidatus Ornithobacterium hominis]MCT7903650.1 GatB/YqeY domain-containing protein [Candidatus Ornithobacterium hominis]SZD70988.1 Uncharacterized conserved protein [Candidatus Ornithobacterium hominis]SZD71663.1 Uncharacterized conserved protein [Candidatus Ornithobacterium hominis]
MKLEEKIMSEMKSAMKAKDKIALEALRAIKSAILMAKTDGSGDELDESTEIALLQKQIKMRKDAAEQFESQNRKEMAENELKQAEVIERFLPEQMSDEEIKSVVIAIIQEVGAESMKDMGKVMNLANEKMAGKADGKTIANMVKNLLNP